MPPASRPAPPPASLAVQRRLFARPVLELWSAQHGRASGLQSRCWDALLAQAGGQAALPARMPFLPSDWMRLFGHLLDTDPGLAPPATEQLVRLLTVALTRPRNLLDLSGIDALLFEAFEQLGGMTVFLGFRRQRRPAVDTLKAPAWLRVAPGWFAGLPEVGELWLPSPLARALDLRGLPRLKAVHLLDPVHAQLQEHIARPAGCGLPVLGFTRRTDAPSLGDWVARRPRAQAALARALRRADTARRLRPPQAPRDWACALRTLLVDRHGFRPADVDALETVLLTHLEQPGATLDLSPLPAPLLEAFDALGGMAFFAAVRTGMLPPLTRLVPPRALSSVPAYLALLPDLEELCLQPGDGPD